VILQLEVPLETVYYALNVARSVGVPSILNPAPAQRLEINRAASATYLIPNEIEAAILGLDEEFEQMIVTLGSEGARYRSRSESFHVPGTPVSAVDTSGAGDAFIGSFAYCLASDLPVRDAIWRANVYAGLSVTKLGTRGSFPTAAEWRRALDRLQNAERQRDDGRNQ
jgi:ribokinase